MENNKVKIKKNFISKELGFTFFSIIIGLLVGGIALKISGFSPLEAYKIIIKGIFSKPKYIAWTVIYSTPLIMTGLSVAFAFKTGLFNIGAEGQFIIGALVATLAGYFLKLPPVIHFIVVFFLAALAGGLWGSIAGYLKAKFGIHEVIATIMLNWIAFYTNNYIVLTEGFRRGESESSHEIMDSASIMLLEGWKRSEEGRAWLANHEIIKDILRAPINLGIIFALMLAIVVWYILNKTTLGYELRTVGLNKYAAEYGGIGVKKSIIMSMFIAGILAGSAGALQVLGVSKSVSSLAFMEGYGFDGIAVSLIGGNSPIGCVLAAFLFGALKYGGPKIQPILHAPTEMINIIIGTIVFFVAIPKLIIMATAYIKRKKGDKDVK